MRFNSPPKRRSIIGVLHPNTKRWRIAIAATAAAALATASLVAAGALAPKTGSGLDIVAVRAVADSDPRTTSATGFSLVTGATTPIVVPAGQTALILARFTAESDCTGPANAVCAVQITADGAPMEPSSIPLESAFDQVGASGDVGSDGNEAHAIDRWKVLGPGTHTIRVEYAVNNATAEFTLDDWTLIVERARKQ